MSQQITSLADVAAIVKRRIWSLVLPFLFCAIIAVAVALLLPSVFRSTSTILIEEQEIPQDYVTTTVTGFAEQRLETINQRIMGTERLLEIINRYDLYPEMRQKKTIEEVVVQMREDIKLETISAEVMDRRTGRATAATIAFTLSYEGEKPRKVQQIANVLTSLFLEENLRVREQQSVEASRFLKAEMDSLQTELNEIEQRVAAYKEKNLKTLPELSQFNLQSLERIENNIDQLRAQISALLEREAFLETQLAAVPDRNIDPERARLHELQTQLTNLLTRVSERYPDVARIRMEIAEIERRLKEDKEKDWANQENQSFITLSSQLASIRSDKESLSQQIETLKLRRNQVQKRIEASPRVEEGYTALMVKRRSLLSKFDDISKRFMEAKIAQGLEAGQMGERFTLIDAARFPEKPVRPNRLAIVFVGLVLGVGLGVALAAVKEFADHTMHSAEALAQAFGLPVLATIPLIVTAQESRRRRIRKLMFAGGVVVLLVVGILGFHYLVMDLDIFWAKLGRRLAL